MNRCLWVKMSNPLYIRYHDQEWGVPVHDDQKHFEFLILEGAQAGLSWETVLNKREAYKEPGLGYEILSCIEGCFPPSPRKCQFFLKIRPTFFGNQRNIGSNTLTVLFKTL